MTKKKPEKGVVRAWGLENKKTGELYPEGYRIRSHAEAALMGCEKRYNIVRVKIIKEEEQENSKYRFPCGSFCRCKKCIRRQDNGHNIKRKKG